jgi:hypothetical protein
LPATQPLVEILDAIVAEADDLGDALLAAVVDRGVAVGVEDDVFALADQRRDHAQIGHVARRKDDRTADAVEVAQRRLGFHMVAEGAVEHAAAVGARSELVERGMAGGDDVRVERHAHVIVRAEQDRVAAGDHRLGRALHLLHHDRERIGDAGIDQRLPLGDQAVELRHQVAFRSDRGGVEVQRLGLQAGLGHASAFSLATASVSWPIFSISACMFIVMMMSNSSSIAATKSITVRLSHSRSPWKVVASVSVTPFLLNGSIWLLIVSRIWVRSVMMVIRMAAKCGGVAAL